MTLAFKLILRTAAIFVAGVVHAESVPAPLRGIATEIKQPPPWSDIFSEAYWQPAGKTALSLQSPLNISFPNPEHTQVRLLWCKDFILVRFDCNDRSIVLLPDSNSAPRDLPYYKADAVEAFLDPVGDGRMYMEFQFSPNHGIFDAIYLCTTTPQSDGNFLLKSTVVDRDLFFIKEWNLPGLQTAARIWPSAEGQGWSVVAAFPAQEILHRQGVKEFAAGMALKFNFVRFNSFLDKSQPIEVTNWSPVLEGCAHISPAGMGTIVLGGFP